MNKTSENGPALICMPDITGFTRFMAETDIEFSRKIIPSLLRNIVNSNTLNLKVGEIEGDAILFFRFGPLPSLKELGEQCINFYLNFNKHLESLEKEFPDDFERYISPSKLSLKIILHAAEITSTNIEGTIKLIGEDMVVVHKLLKNTVKEPEYILLTEKLLSNYTEDEILKTFHWFTLEKSEDEYEYIGSIKYRHIPLEPLLIEIKEQANENIQKRSTKKSKS